VSAIPTQPTLEQLTHADLIRRVQEIEATYQFKHNLIQESAYSSLLKNDRRALHRACAEALERTYPNDLDEHAALLAKHFAEAGDDAKTFSYARRAGDAALRTHAHAEALMQYDTAALLAARLEIPTADLIQVHEQRGRVLELMWRYEDAVEAYRALSELGQTRSEPQMELRGQLALATLYTFPNQVQNLATATRLNQRALALAREMGAHEEQVRALWNAMLQAYFTGRTDDAVRFSEEALALAERLGLRERRAYILNDVSRALITARGVPHALAALAEARQVFREFGNLPMLADNFSSAGEAAQMGGEFDLAEQFVHDALTLSREIGNTWNLSYSYGTLTQIHVAHGDTRAALAALEKAIEYGSVSGFHVSAKIGDVVRAELYGRLGAYERALASVSTDPDTSDFLFMEAWRLGTRALIQLAQRDTAGARVTLERARASLTGDDLSNYGPIFIALCDAEMALQETRYSDAVQICARLAERLRAIQLRYFLPDLLLIQARAHLLLNELDAAERVLRETETYARAMHARFALWETLALLSKLAQQRGAVEHARALQDEARAVVEWIVAHAPDDLRATFLAQQKVREIWE
jgi:tetratricopeptide (TPR) repeat protein